MYQQLVERIVQEYGSGEWEEEIRRARGQYFRRVPELKEDDSSYDALTAFFLDWYVFQRPLSALGLTPLQHYAGAVDHSNDDYRLLCSLAASVHSVYRVVKVEKNGLHLEDLFTGERIRVSERRALVGLERDNVLEARLYPLAERLVFEGASFMVHPPVAEKYLRRVVDAHRSTGRPARLDIILELEALGFRYVDRFRQRVEPERVYGELEKLAD